MPQKSGFFDTTADDPREYPAREFAEYFARFIGNGIFGGGEKLKVTASGKDMNVSVNLGYGWISGYMYAVYDTPLVLPIQQATTQDRIDRIVLRLDVSTPVRAIRAIVLQGNPAPTPQAPAIVRSGDIHDLSLAQVLVKANTSTIQQFQVTDERLNNQVCGIVTGVIQQADTTSIFNQFQSWLNTKTAEYQKQWEDFLKTVQDEGFAPMKHTHDAADIVSGLIDTARLRGATTSQFGVCKIYDGVDGGPGGYIAASPLAVKQVYDEMMLVKQSVVDGKGKVAGAINDMGGGPVSANNTFDELAAAIRSIQGASGDTGYTRDFLAHFSQSGADDKISGRFWFNKDGNAVGLIKPSYDSHQTYNIELIEVSVAGTIVSRKTLDTVYSTRGFNGGFGIVTPDLLVYICTPGRYESEHLRVRKHDGTLLVDSQLDDNDIYKYTRIIDATAINGQYRFSTLVEYGTDFFNLGIVDQNINILFRGSAVGGYSDFETGGRGRFIDRNTAMAYVGGGHQMVRWNGTAFTEVYGGWLTRGTHQNILSAFAYRD